MKAVIWAWCAMTVAMAGCGSSNEQVQPNTQPAAAKVVRISIVGTSDLHGHIETLPLMDAHIDVIRRRRDGVILVDAGDMFQGTLASNLSEGAAVVNLYNAMGYSAAAIGNHEFDFGVAGPAVLATEPGQDVRGALKASAAKADFPFLAANIVHADTGLPFSSPNIMESTMVSVAGVKVGIVGVATQWMAEVILRENFSGLAILPMAETIEHHAKKLRSQGANVVVVVAHAGGDCDPSKPAASSPCRSSEIAAVAQRLPPGVVDVMVAGHTHQEIGRKINGISVIQAFSHGQAFGRVDIDLARNGSILHTDIFPTRLLCQHGDADTQRCEPGAYEGVPIEPSPDVAQLVETELARVVAVANEPLGVRVAEPIRASRTSESALGNLFTDLMRAAQPHADIAITNGGGLRADLEPGELTYGRAFEAWPFDNSFATVTLYGEELAELLATNLKGSGALLSLSGVTAIARCAPDLTVTLFDKNRMVPPKRKLVVVLSNFLAHGGDGLLPSLNLPKDRYSQQPGENIREAMIAVLRRRGGVLSGRTLLSGAQERFRYPGERPVDCSDNTRTEIHAQQTHPHPTQPPSDAQANAGL